MIPEIGSKTNYDNIPTIPPKVNSNINGLFKRILKDGGYLLITYNQGIKHGPARYFSRDGKMHDFLFICDRPIQMVKSQEKLQQEKDLAVQQTNADWNQFFDDTIPKTT